MVIGFGGGSAIDAAKAIATLVANGGDPLDYMEGIGAGKPLTQPALPIIAIPTTAGTGAEVTRNAVVASPEHRVKASLRSPFMLPRLALVDPELTYSLPPEVTAGTGLDALTQLIEPFTSHRANPMTDAFCHEGLAAPPVRCAAPTNTALTPQHARIWRWRVCSAGWRWRTPDWAPRTVRHADLWHVPGPARRDMRRAAAACDGSQHRCAPRTPAGRSGATRTTRSWRVS